MSKFNPTPEADTAAKQLNRDLQRADKEARRQLTAWMQMVDMFWQAPVTHADNAASMAHCQEKLDSDPAAAVVMLASSKSFIEYHYAQDAALVQEMVDPRYLLEGAYVWGEGLTLVSLRPEYEVQSEEV
jgi:hypothetical protein